MNLRFRNSAFLILTLSFHFHAISQNKANFGSQIGLTLNFGTHVNSVGLITNVFYQANFYQINLGTQTKFNFTSYGKRKMFTETRIALGTLLLAGKQNNTIDFQLDALNHNTKYDYALGFNYLWYFDEAKTSQRSGAWSIHAKKVSILFENDVFGGQARDKFRTGTMQISYRTEDMKLFTNLYLWTGETRNSVWIKDSLPNCPNGYRSLENLPYGKTSHGILSFGINSNLNNYMKDNFYLNNQISTVKIGVDDEQIRHIVQNKISHDLIFMPKSYKRNTPHYPRLNSEGKPVFIKNEIRKPKLYFQASLNEIWSN
ncbi:MAG: polymorphic toxin type 23 domain-containing protein [Bacteroidota bacterium]